MMAHLSHFFLFLCWLLAWPHFKVKTPSNFARANGTHETGTEKFWPNNSLFLLGQNLSVKSMNDAFYCV